MKTLLLLLLTATCFGQGTPIPVIDPATMPRELPDSFVQKVCGAPVVKQGPQFEEVQRIMRRVAPVLDTDRAHVFWVAVVDQPQVVNAFANNLGGTSPFSLICIPTGIVWLHADAEGELAFVISHEIGHTIDDACKPPNRPFNQQQCEMRADSLGFNILIAAGYNAYNAAGAFGRLEMFSGDTDTGFLARINAIWGSHPITADRIQNIRRIVLEHFRQTQGR